MLTSTSGDFSRSKRQPSRLHFFCSCNFQKFFFFAENTFLLFDLRCATLSVDVCGGGLVRVLCVHRILIVDLMLEK